MTTTTIITALFDIVGTFFIAYTLFYIAFIMSPNQPDERTHLKCTILYTVIVCLLDLFLPTWAAFVSSFVGTVVTYYVLISQAQYDGKLASIIGMLFEMGHTGLVYFIPTILAQFHII